MSRPIRPYANRRSGLRAVAALALFAVLVAPFALAVAAPRLIHLPTPRPVANLPARLKQIYDPRPDKIIFIKGDPKVTYQDVIQAMDAARGAGVKVIGFTPKGA